MSGEELLYFGFCSFMLGVSIFCANVLLLKKQHRQIYWPLGLFFVAEAASSAPTILNVIATQRGMDEFIMLLAPLNLPFSMMLAPLFWLYVRGLTTEDSFSDLRYKVLHAVPAMYGLCVSVLLLILPYDVYETLEAEGTSDHALVPIIIFAIWALTILFYAQVGFYVVLIIRLLTFYNTRLKDLFSSTEHRELYWVWWISIVCACFLIFNVANVLVQLLGVQILPTSVLEQPVIDVLVNTAVIWVLALWGFRQKPGLIRERASDTREEQVSVVNGQKYERSALSEEQAQRLARKIRSAMQNSLLYRDPNLSLWDLSKHIGVTSNYLSQTLNETIGTNFFDYVNRWRIEDAVERIENSEETVLAIAYDVGFNSKSSFYKAFKKHVGMTPSALRNSRVSEDGKMVKVT
ncbi:AraC family transcriptional regulator [uncultured Roseobacter sp.]|uniref:helix-turn-helix domain-containing protein n=1 Tax=uncultured Roseobacter sp. TaxID=114847 RepID=UPI002604F846|nr:helix-turn-helix transcriptional regulator [uncultured Roseobacter sp.]